MAGADLVLYLTLADKEPEAGNYSTLNIPGEPEMLGVNVVYIAKPSEHWRGTGGTSLQDFAKKISPLYFRNCPFDLMKKVALPMKCHAPKSEMLPTAPLVYGSNRASSILASFLLKIPTISVGSFDESHNFRW